MLSKQKLEKKFGAELKKGSKIVTRSGVHAKVVDLNDADNTCIIETMSGKLKVEKSSISMEMSQKLNNPEKK